MKFLGSRASKRVLGATQGRYRKTLEQKRQEMLVSFEYIILFSFTQLLF